MSVGIFLRIGANPATARGSSSKSKCTKSTNSFAKSLLPEEVKLRLDADKDGGTCGRAESIICFDCSCVRLSLSDNGPVINVLFIAF